MHILSKGADCPPCFGRSHLKDGGCDPQCTSCCSAHRPVKLDYISKSVKNVFYIRLMSLGFIGSRFGAFVNSWSQEKCLEQKLKLNINPLLRPFCTVKWELRNDLREEG